MRARSYCHPVALRDLAAPQHCRARMATTNIQRACTMGGPSRWRPSCQMPTRRAVRVATSSMTPAAGAA
jgi:hypothetical protein